MKCRIVRLQRPGMVELYLPQYKGWFLWHNIPKHVEGGTIPRWTQYYYTLEEAEHGLRKFLFSTPIAVPSSNIVKEFEL